MMIDGQWSMVDDRSTAKIYDYWISMTDRQLSMIDRLMMVLYYR